MNNKPLKPHLRQTNVGSWASSELKDKVKYHLEMSVKAWHDWEIDLPLQVEVICNEVKRNRGQFLSVKRWLIIPPKSGLKECLVAEIDNDVHIHINHLVPAVF
jgi:hypothetical protein